MQRFLAPAILALVVTLSGCASSTAAEGTPTASAKPSASPSPTTNPTPTPTPTVVMPTVEAEEPIETPSYDPPQTPPRGPDDVDPALYPSRAVDTVNGNAPLPGVEFSTQDGAITCGILTWGHFSTPAGFASCTVNRYRDIFPQPNPDGPPLIQSIQVEPANGVAFLYPDWFGQPARTIPVLPAGKSIHYEGTTCTAEGASGIRCVVAATGSGFTLTSSAYTRF